MRPPLLKRERSVKDKTLRHYRLAYPVRGAPPVARQRLLSSARINLILFIDGSLSGFFNKIRDCTGGNAYDRTATYYLSQRYCCRNIFNSIREWSPAVNTITLIFSAAVNYAGEAFQHRS